MTVINIDDVRLKKHLETYKYFELLGGRDYGRKISFRNNPYSRETALHEHEAWIRGWWAECLKDAAQAVKQPKDE